MSMKLAALALVVSCASALRPARRVLSHGLSHRSYGLSRRSLLAAGCVALAHAQRATALDDEALEQVEGNGFRLLVPPSYYRPKGGRPKTGVYDDNVFVAADYVGGRAISVSRTPAAALLIDSGDPIAVQSGPLQDLNELGKPLKVAQLLARRREGDPGGASAQPRSEVVSVARTADEVRFVLRELTYTQVSATAAKPSARYTRARTLFVPASEDAGVPASYLLTVWASSPAPSVNCIAVPCDCGERGSLLCDCPAPKCEDGSDALAPSAIEAAIVESLRLPALQAAALARR